VNGLAPALEIRGTPVRSAAAGGEENARDASAGNLEPDAPSRDNVCAVLVTHNPDAGFACRVEKIRPQVAGIVIVDNASAEPGLGQVRHFESQDGLHLICNEMNHGIARALNQGAQWAANCGYRWILTFDQDTEAAPGMVEALSDVYRALPDPKQVAVLGANYRHRENGKVATKGTYEAGSGAREVKAVITSGSLIPLSALAALGGFREDFFMDCVDVDYCLRARAQGFCVLRTVAPLMQHSVGHLTEHRLLGKAMATTNHSPWRRYLQVRNSVILAREYLARDPALVLSALASRAQEILRVCLFERQRRRKLVYCWLGLVDGLRGKMNRPG
jgi:rhamnosyltransferase